MELDKGELGKEANFLREKCFSSYYCTTCPCRALTPYRLKDRFGNPSGHTQCLNVYYTHKLYNDANVNT